jgi:hypothetical protein
MADETADALRKLEDRLGRASEEAERLIAEAQQRPPSAGWQTPPGDGSTATPRSELDALINALRSLRDLVPPEVMHRMADAIKEVLLAVRALIDHYLERLEHRPEKPAEVQDIPID